MNLRLSSINLGLETKMLRGLFKILSDLSHHTNYGDQTIMTKLVTQHYEQFSNEKDIDFLRLK